MKRWRWLPFLLSYLWPQKIRISKGVKKIWILEVVFFFRYEWRELPHRDVRDWIIKLSIFVQFIKVELWAHRAKTSTVISSFYCSFVMFYICLTFVPSLKKKMWIVHHFQRNDLEQMETLSMRSSDFVYYSYVLLLVFSVTPLKIDQNKNQNCSIDKVRNLGNERR